MNTQIRDVRGSLRVPVQKGAFFYANALILLMLLAVTLFMLGLLRSVLRTIRDGAPFVRANATRIRWIAFAVIGIEVARAAITYVESSYAMTHFSVEGLCFDARPEINLFAIVQGLIILAIAEVFRAGTRLNEDQSLTV